MNLCVPHISLPPTWPQPVLLEERATIDFSMASPLLVASQGGHFEVVQVLIEAAADLDKATSSTGFTSLLVASQKGHSEVVRLLIAAGADKEKSSNGAGITPLIMASQRGHLEVVRLLVEAGADKEKATKAKSDEATPLLMASQENRLEVVRCLIQAGADKNKASAVMGITPLLMAAQRNHLDVARVLLEARADLEIGSQDGMTPLLASCAQGHLKMVQLLLEHADVDDLTTDTAASMALEAGHVDVEEFLHQLEGKKRRKVEDGVRWFFWMQVARLPLSDPSWTWKVSHSERSVGHQNLQGKRTPPTPEMQLQMPHGATRKSPAKKGVGETVRSSLQMGSKMIYHL